MRATFLIIELFLYFLSLQTIISKIVGCKNKNYIYSVLLFGIYAILIFSIMMWKTIFVYIYMVSQFFQVIIVRLINRKSKISTILGIYLFLYSLALIINSFFVCVFLLSEEQSYIVELLLHCCIFIFVLFCCYQKTIRFKIIYVLNVLSKKIKILLLVYLLVNILFLASILVYISSIDILFWNVVLRLLLALISLFIFVFVPIIIIITLSNSYLKLQNERFQKDIEAQVKHYSDLAKANYELRRFKHDFGNMKIGLSQYLKEKDCAGALDMLNSAAIDMQRSSDDIVGFDTGNGIVDAILADKQSMAKTNNIKIIFSGSVPPNSIAPTDLCIIFGNTLDNAIEACEKISDDIEKIIFVTCRCNSGFVFIDITNPVAEDVVINGINVETSKPDKASHGYGLYSLNKTVKKLDGEVKLSCENKIFKVEIDFSVEQNIIYA